MTGLPTPSPSPSPPPPRPRRPRPLWKTLALVAGTVLVVTGVPLFVTPIPVGAVMVGAGLALLLKASPHARLARRALARRFPGTAARIDRLMRRRGAR